MKSLRPAILLSSIWIAVLGWSSFVAADQDPFGDLPDNPDLGVFNPFEDEEEDADEFGLDDLDDNVPPDANKEVEHARRLCKKLLGDGCFDSKEGEIFLRGFQAGVEYAQPRILPVSVQPGKKVSRYDEVVSKADNLGWVRTAACTDSTLQSLWTNVKWCLNDHAKDDKQGRGRELMLLGVNEDRMDPSLVALGYGLCQHHQIPHQLINDIIGTNPVYSQIVEAIRGGRGGPISDALKCGQENLFRQARNVVHAKCWDGVGRCN